MDTVSGVFDSRNIAEGAIAELMGNGFSKGDISLIMSDETRNRLFGAEGDGMPDDTGSRVAKGGVAGAVIGGVLGALLAGLTAVGSIILTSGGAILMSGPIVATLSGIGAGATVGGVAGALIRAGFAVDDANRYEEELHAGKVVVIVHASDSNRAILARNALQRTGAMRLETA